MANAKSAYSNVNFTVADSLLRYAEFLGYGDIHLKVDKETGLQAIVAIHNLSRGPAIGGCRFVEYPHQPVSAAIEDAVRLGYMMTFKAAICNLPHGGAKSVIIKPKVIKDREALFAKFGEFVNDLGGRYIAAIDSGSTIADMDIIRKYTPYVTCTSGSGGESDPSPLTALGVRRGIEAAVKFKFGQKSLNGLHVAIQGAGHVGYHLAKELHALGARLTMTDINQQALKKCAEEFGASICAPSEIYSLEADIFAPCALGAVLNLENISQLKVSIVAGSANNQLAHAHFGTLMHERGILYAPDFLINSGGLIHVAICYANGTMEKTFDQINGIYDTALEIFEQSLAKNLSTNQIAESIALKRLNTKPAKYAKLSNNNAIDCVKSI